MGASKRLAELIVLANAEEVNLENLDNENKTKFSMVRFGNVLNSSGSVVPLFLNQIAEGGPITLTHPDIIRYFMTIPEAAQLVLQASVFSKGGEVFLLDMGAPVRIIDLARKLINLNSLTEKNSNNPDGDIEIQIKGLRPGEKLYEEMLISDNSEKTENPLIFKAKEQFIKSKDLWPEIELLKSAIDNKNINGSLNTLKKLVPEWKSSPKKNNKDFLNQ
jgi:FlaA1/EpsC-like NDP-sugar epimerase